MTGLVLTLAQFEFTNVRLADLEERLSKDDSYHGDGNDLYKSEHIDS